MTQHSRRSTSVRWASYWPQLGVIVGVSLNLAGLVAGDPALIATGSNALTLSGLYLAQRRKNRNDG